MLPHATTLPSAFSSAEALSVFDCNRLPHSRHNAAILKSSVLYVGLCLELMVTWQKKMNPVVPTQGICDHVHELAHLFRRTNLRPTKHWLSIEIHHCHHEVGLRSGIWWNVGCVIASNLWNTNFLSCRLNPPLLFVVASAGQSYTNS
eukprot:gnl/MRDRNA2_/MRDRNA2_83277_c0_seq5.p1 gnl/MRDRNA2_/MRDRNA2_83277_c0~~gnl/MRDRNA2_/MRDRNA2_83277_c0_seq5.p1  ORF type:complete len:147 (-),score=1.32 gnl/MRDRNA2_/MRDRNA2_83277_c0_seq5:146-586(-)